MIQNSRLLAVLLATLPATLPGTLACYPLQDINVPTIETTTTPTTPGDGGTTVDPLAVNSVTPTDGPTSGGTTVVIEGGPFTNQAQVRFGDQTTKVESIDENQITVQSPAVGAAGLVEISITQDAAGGSMPDAFHYWEDAQGKTVLVATWLQLEIANPETWTTSAPTFDAWVRFIQPTDAVPSDRYGVALDTCGEPRDPLSSLVGPDEIRLGYSDFMLSLTWSKARQEYAYLALARPDPREDQAIVLEAARSDQGPALALPEAVYTPSQITLLTPDLGGDGLPELPYGSATVTWTPGGYSHVMIIGGTSDAARFVCMASDDGALTIPSTQFDDFAWTTVGPTRRTELWLAVAGVTSDENHLDWVNGTARVDAGMGLIGRLRVVDEKPVDTGITPVDTGLTGGDSGTTTVDTGTKSGR